jgi:hypothetical protein
MRAWLALALLAACQKPSAPAPGPAPVADVPVPAAPGKKPGLDVAASVVEVPCADSQGVGFFVSESQVVTRFHFICSGDEALRVKLPDGRTLLGKLRWKDETLDAAMIEVEGGDGEPLAVGDASVVVLSGLLKDAKLKDDAVSELARLHFAVEYADVVPPEGSPVVDEQGQVIAMVARKLEGKRALVLPLPVLAEAGATLTVPKARWNEIEARARPAAEAEVTAAREALSRAVVASAVLDSDGNLFALVVRQQNLSGGSFKLTAGSCTMEISTTAWVPFDVRDAIDLSSKRLFSYFARARLDAGLVTGVMRLDGCKAKRGTGLMAGEGKTAFELAVVGQLDRTLTATMPSVAPAALPAPVGRRERERLPTEEQDWRRRYREVRRHIADVERSIEDDKRFIDYADHHGNDVRMPMWRLSPAERQRYDETKERLKHSDELRDNAHAELDALDHEAANAAVPLEWRH